MGLLRRLMAAFAGLAVAAVMLVAVGIVWLRSEPGRAFLRGRLEVLLALASGARVTLRAVESPRLDTVVLRDVVLSIPGHGVLRADAIAVVFGIPDPVFSTIGFRRIAIDGLAGRLVRRDGSFGFPSRGDGDGDGGRSVRIDRLSIRDARLGIHLLDGEPPRRLALTDVDLDMALTLGPDGQRFDVAALHAVPRGVPLEAVDLAGRVDLHRDGSVVADDLRAVSGATRLDGRLDLDAARTVDAALRARSLDPRLLALLASDLTLPPGTTVDATARGPLRALRVGGTIDLAGAGALAVRGRVDATTTPVAFRLAVESPGVAVRAIRPGWPDVRAGGVVHARGRGRHHVTLGRLASRKVGAVRWRAHGTTGAQPTYRVQASGEIRDAAPLARSIDGRGRFRIDAVRPGATAADARVRLDVERGVVQGVAIDQGTANAVVDGERVRVESLVVAGPRGRLTADGTIDLGRDTVDATLAADLPDGTRLESVAALARRRGRWGGTLDRLEIRRPDVGPWTLDAPAPVILGEATRIGPFHLRSGPQRATLEVSIGAAQRLDGRLTVSALDLTPWCALSGTTCSGTASATLVASGTTTAPSLRLDAAADEVGIGPLRRASLEARLRHEQGRASGELRFGGAGGEAVVTGSTPLALPGLPVPRSSALDLEVTARRIQLARFAVWWPRMVSAADGRVRADLRIGGTWAQPQPSGTVTLRADDLVLAPSGAQWTDVHVVLRPEGTGRLAIEKLAATGGGGTLTGRGHFDFGTGWVPTAQVQLMLRDFLAVDRPLLEAETSGTLRIDGPLTGPVVRGQLSVPEATIRPAFLPSSNAATDADPTIDVVGLPEAEGSPPPAGLGQLTLGVTLVLGDDVRIRRRDADIQVAGSLRIQRTPPEPLHVDGTVEIVRGWYTFQGRRFTLRNGSVRFTGGKVGDAKLDLEAWRRSGDYDVTVALAGTLEDPVLLLSSDPPLDEADVLAVLVVGRPAGELSDQERLAVQAEATSLAVGYVVPDLQGQLGEALGVDEVSLSAEQLRVSRRVGQDVFISLSQQFVGWAGQTVGIEYQISRRLSVELSTSSRGSGAIDFFWRRRY
jgi:autotransporter translocation and assembly factor TamB